MKCRSRNPNHVSIARSGGMKPFRLYVVSLTSDVLFMVYVIMADRPVGLLHAPSTMVVVFPDPAEARIIRLFNGTLDVLRNLNSFCTI